ncbi:ARF-binding protein [Rhodotorula kratochvilovae]
MDRLLLINDLINQILKRYEAFKAGNRTATADIDPALASGQPGAKARSQAKQVSLIDFDDDDAFSAPSPNPQAGTPAPTAAPTNPLDDLASLSLGSAPAPSAASSIDGSLFDLNSAFGASAPAAQPAPSSSSTGLFSLPALQPSNGSPSPAPRPSSASSGGGGSFFSNPAYANGTARTSSPFGGGNGGLGSIQLGVGAANGAAGKAAGSSPPLPPVPPKQGAQAPPPAQKDAFADLLGDF